jgi:hypothetical protein
MRYASSGAPAVPLAPRRGLVAGVRRLLFGDRVKRAHVSDHGAFMRSAGRLWAIPMTLVFSSGALITLGQKQIGAIVGALQHHQAPDYVTVALLLITFVIVGGMDLTLLNSAVELRDARLRGVDPRTDPYTRGATLRVWLVSLIESATFMSVAYQLDRPPALTADAVGCLVAWAFIVARALVAPICAMYLATLGKRAMVRREMYGNLLLTIGGTIQQILENLQFAADERLIEPLWRMQVLVDRASRAQTDAEMDRFDEELLRALGELRTLRDRLGQPGQPGLKGHVAQTDVLDEAAQVVAAVDTTATSAAPAGDGRARSRPSDQGDSGEAGAESEDEVPPMPTARYNSRRVTARLEATR